MLLLTSIRGVLFFWVSNRSVNGTSEASVFIVLGWRLMDSFFVYVSAEVLKLFPCIWSECIVDAYCAENNLPDCASLWEAWPWPLDLRVFHSWLARLLVDLLVDLCVDPRKELNFNLSGLKNFLYCCSRVAYFYFSCSSTFRETSLMWLPDGIAVELFPTLLLADTGIGALALLYFAPTVLYCVMAVVKSFYDIAWRPLNYWLWILLLTVR